MTRHEQFTGPTKNVRLRAWTRVLEAVADMRDELQYWVGAGDACERDVQHFCELTNALAY
jgi:hypothetical protein